MKYIIFIFALLFVQNTLANYQVAGVSDKCEWWDDATNDYCYTDEIYPTIEAACAAYDISLPFGKYDYGFVPWDDSGCVPTNYGYPDEYLFVPVRKLSLTPIVCLPAQIPLKNSNGIIVNCKYAELTCAEYETPVYDSSGKLKQCKLENACLPTQTAYYDSIGNLAACEDMLIIENDEEKNENALKDTSNLFNDILNKFKNLLDIFTDLFDQIKNIFNDENNQNNDEENNQEIPEIENVNIEATHTDLPDFLYSLFPTSAQCPQDNTLTLLSKDYTFSYMKLCNALSLLSNLVMTLSIYIGYRIIRSV